MRLFGENERHVRTSETISLDSAFSRSNLNSQGVSQWDDFDMDQIATEYPNYTKRLSTYKPSRREDIRESAVYPEVIFLGTSSTQPTSMRNVSGILVKTSIDRSILMDCGEGTIAQMMKFYERRFNDEAVKLTAVFLSHFHADHHTGLYELVAARWRAFRSLSLAYEKLYVCLPKNLRPFFNSISRFVGLTNDNDDKIEINNLVS